ncbi:hypothetical protein ACP4OV_010118 [Aristida adscensionis]
MPRKRPHRVIHLSDNSDYGVSESDDDDADFLLDSDGDCTAQMGYDDGNSSDSGEIQAGLYKLYIKQRHEMKKLKSKIQGYLKHRGKKVRPDVIEKDAFTRFSVSYFSKVIESLSPERRQTGDIIVKLRTVPFPKDYAVGKSYILSRFKQTLVPCVKFFGNKIIEQEELSEEDLIVYYLDFVDFGHRQVPPGLPRISVWKQSMITEYSELDMVCPGTYGYRPVMDISRTCYSKAMCFPVFKSCSMSKNQEFIAALDSNSGCNLPDRLKLLICTLLEEHSMKSALKFNMEITSLASLQNVGDQNALDSQQQLSNVQQKTLNRTSQYSLSPHVATGDNPKFSNRNVSHFSGANTNNDISIDHPDKQNNTPVPANVDNIMKKLSKKDTVSPTTHTPVHCPPAFSHVFDKRGSYSILSKKKSRKVLINDYTTESDIAQLRDPYADFDNQFDEHAMKVKKFVKFETNNSDRDISQVMMLLVLNHHLQMSMLVSSNSNRCWSFNSRKFTNVDANLEDSIPFSERVTPNLSQYRNASISKSKLPPSSKRSKPSPECVVTGERNIFQKSSELAKRCDEIYNRNIMSREGDGANKCSMPSHVIGHDIVDADQLNCNVVCNDDPNSSGGKLPHYGPRRTIYPVIPDPVFPNESRIRFRLTDSEKKNYTVICKLGHSKYKDLDAVHIGGVRCTFRSFGESVKPGGFVSNFLIAVFCRHLFMKDHPEQSKKHYFFSNVGDNLLKDPTEASQYI